MKRFIAVLFCTILLSVTCADTPYFFSATAETLSVEELNKKLAALDKQQKETQAELNKVNKEKAATNEKVNLLESQITNTKTEISTLNALITSLNKDLNAKSEEKKKLSDELSASYEIYKQRIRTDYEEVQTTYLDVLFGSKSLSDFMTRLDIISQINEYENKLIDDMKSKIARLNEVVASIEQDKAETLSAKQKLSEKNKALNEQQEESEDLLKELNTTAAELKKELKKEQQESERLNSELNKLMSSGTQYSGGIMAWPIPGCYTITSYFGPRSLLGMTFHYGVDVGTNRVTGKQVVAANAGTVIYAKYDVYGGNMIMIDHGGGIATRYLHLSAFKASVGSTVTRGQVIALSGNTGLKTTGPHLHFEVIVNGTRVDPLSYIKAK